MAKIKELTDGLGAHSVIEAVGTQEAMMQAIRSTRAGGHVGYVGVAHGVELPGDELFYSHTHMHGGPAPARRFLPQLTDHIWSREIDPGKVFDLPANPTPASMRVVLARTGPAERRIHRPGPQAAPDERSPWAS